MLLAVNIGNSNIRFGIAKGFDVKKSWTINTKPYKTTDELFCLVKNSYKQYKIDKKSIENIVIGSVVPHQTRIVCNALEQIHQIKPLVVDRNSKSGVTHHSNQMGTDLYANAVAANYFYKGKKIIIDFGTALTLTGIDENGNFLGVVIAPGVITSLKALIGDTAQLPDIEIKEPKSVLGKDTETCMQSGIVYGYVGMVEGLINRIIESLGEKCFIISTGGLGHLFKPLIPKIDIDDKWHTLKGLCILFEQNKKL